MSLTNRGSPPGRTVNTNRLPWWDRYFEMTARGSTLGTEVVGGLATFATMAYIVVLNPIILTAAADVTGAQLDFAEVTAVTALVAAGMTIAMGIIGRYPFAIAAGLGLNGVVAFQLASQMSWEAAMGVVVIEGLVITFLVLTGFREAVMNAIPQELKLAISVGIGLFIAFIGFVDAGFVRRTGAPPVPVELGSGGRLIGWPTVVFVFGLLLVAVLVARRVRWAILGSIVLTTIFAIVLNSFVDVGPQLAPGQEFNPAGWALNVPKLPGWDNIAGWPELGLLGEFSLGGLPNLQMTVMSIEPGGEVGLEVHPELDQFLRIEQGKAKVVMGASKDNLDFEREAEDDFAIFVPANTWHNIINIGDEPLKLYSIYAPPNHPHSTVHKDYAEAEAAEAEEHGH